VLIVNINQSGQDYVQNEITEHYSPEINGRFIRVTQADGKQIFISGLPKDGTFDPVRVPPPQLPVSQAFSHEVEMSDGHEILLHARPTKQEMALPQSRLGAYNQSIYSAGCC
jgi:hypothetical protein